MTQTLYHEGWPQPYRLPDAEPYWRALDEEQLTYQRCDACSEAVWPAHSYCPHCGSPALAWKVSSGRGTVYSFSTVMRGPTAVWKELAPYTVGFVRMEEGYYLFTQFDGEPGAIKIDQSVAVRFVPRGKQKLPVFYPV